MRADTAAQTAMQNWLAAVTAVTPWAGMRAVYLPEVDSTNRYALACGATSTPVLVWAGRQTAGVGRQGRQWVHEPERSLALSIGVPYVPTTWEGLSLVVGLAVAQALHPQVQLKWPNDLWWQQGKLGGILIQTGALAATAQCVRSDACNNGGRYAVIGIGLNLGAVTLPTDGVDGANGAGGAQPVAGCDAFLPPDDLLPEPMLMRVVPPVLAYLARFQERGFQPFKNAYNAIDGLRGRRVQTSDGVCALAQGVNSAGGLLLQTEDGGWQTYSGLEVSVRPVVDA